MPSSYVAGLSGLHSNVTTIDILEFLDGVNVAGGSAGVHLITYSRWTTKMTGEALVECETSEDFVRALSYDKQFLGKQKIEVFAGDQKQLISILNEGKTIQADRVVKIRGIPWDVTEKEIENFFHALQLDQEHGIYFVLDNIGRRSTVAYVQFANEQDCEKALMRHMQKIRHRFIEIFRSSRGDLLRIMADDIDLKKTANKRPRSRSPERSGEYKRRQNRSPHRHETNVIEMKENKDESLYVNHNVLKRNTYRQQGPNTKHGENFNQNNSVPSHIPNYDHDNNFSGNMFPNNPNDQFFRGNTENFQIRPGPNNSSFGGNNNFQSFGENPENFQMRPGPGPNNQSFGGNNFVDNFSGPNTGPNFSGDNNFGNDNSDCRGNMGPNQFNMDNSMFGNDNSNFHGNMGPNNQFNNMDNSNMHRNTFGHDHNMGNNFNGNMCDEYEQQNFGPHHEEFDRNFVNRNRTEMFEQYTENSFKKANNATDFSMIIKVKIVDYAAPNHKMAKEQGFLIQNRLIHVLDADIACGILAPQFYGAGIVNGAYKITCADQYAIKWLHVAVDKLGEPWQGAKLRLLYRHEIPKFTNIILIISGPSEDWSKIVMRLKAQNPQLKCHLWQLFKRTKNRHKSGDIIYVGIDPDSLLYIEKMEKRLHYGFTKISCAIIHKNTDEN